MIVLVQGIGTQTQVTCEFYFAIKHSTINHLNSRAISQLQLIDGCARHSIARNKEF